MEALGSVLEQLMHEHLMFLIFTVGPGYIELRYIELVAISNSQKIALKNM